MKDEYHIESIKQVRKKIDNGNNLTSSIVGVIVDCTSPNRKDVRKDFLMRLKVTDASSPQDALQVYLYAKSIDEFPKGVKIGDIIFLHKYHFELWNNVFQAKKAYQQPHALCRFFSGNPEFLNYAHVDAKTGLDDSDGSILSAINECRKFSKTYFKLNSVPMYNQSNTPTTDFDMILQVNECILLTTGAYCVRMTNCIHQFEINSSIPIKPAVYKIRSIANFVWKEKVCYLQGNDYTYFMEIPEWMKSHDSKEWEKLAPPAKSSEKKVERQNIETNILNEKRGSLRPTLTLHELIKKDEHEEEVRVKVEFMDFHTSFEQALKRHDRHNLIEKSYESEAGELIYSIHATVSDKTISNEVFNVYIYTYDGRGLEFLPELHPKNIFGRNILSLREKYIAMINRLLEETEIDEHPIEIVLSPMWNGKETIYRIVDTELLL